MRLMDLPQEAIDRLSACRDREEVEKVLEEEGIVLSDDELEMVVGGASTGSSDFFDKYKKNKA